MTVLKLHPASDRHGREAWDRALQEVFTDPSRIAIAFQPIADTNRGVVAGYESLARFTSTQGTTATPDLWFQEADRRGCGLELEMLAVRRALQARSSLPANCFLTVNVSPGLLLSPGWAALVAATGRLDNVIVEVTEHAAITDYAAVRVCIERIRTIGGGFAVDDAGSGFASLNHVLALRPNFVKLDRVFVAGCDADPAKLALIEMMGSFAGRLDAWIITEGIETFGELKALFSLKVPLAQGYLLGKPQREWGSIAPDVARALLSWREERLAGRAVRLAAEQAQNSFTLDEWERPVALSLPDGRIASDVMRVKASSPAADVLRRALARDATRRFDPIAVIDELGRLESMVRIERLVEVVAFDSGDANP